MTNLSLISKLVINMILELYQYVCYANIINRLIIILYFINIGNNLNTGMNLTESARKRQESYILRIIAMMYSMGQNVAAQII